MESPGHYDPRVLGLVGQGIATALTDIVYLDCNVGLSEKGTPTTHQLLFSSESVGCLLDEHRSSPGVFSMQETQKGAEGAVSRASLGVACSNQLCAQSNNKLAKLQAKSWPLCNSKNNLIWGQKGVPRN